MWSKLQSVKLLHPQFDLCVVIETDTMSVQSMNELFWHEAPAAVWRGTKTVLQGKKRDERSYGTAGGQGGERPLGGINGGLVLMRPSREEFEEMLRRLQTYSGCGLGADQDFLTDCWKKQRRNTWIAESASSRADGSSRTIEPAARMEAVGPSSRQCGGDAAIEPVVRMRYSRAVEPAVRMGDSRAIEPAVRYRRCGRSYNW